jgi:hypothetical protein
VHALQVGDPPVLHMPPLLLLEPVESKLELNLTTYELLLY